MAITKLDPEALVAPLVGGVIERPDVANINKDEVAEEDKNEENESGDQEDAASNPGEDRYTAEGSVEDPKKD
ncbi:MAG TPA: hypothetical protein VK772_14730 [Puia sp.]|jgi:hypothetical protein|nr:hypothetical protein [Puia sp.]